MGAMTREDLGRLVHQTWLDTTVGLFKTGDVPALPWDDLPKQWREVDRLVGELAAERLLDAAGVERVWLAAHQAVFGYPAPRHTPGDFAKQFERIGAAVYEVASAKRVG
jgi:hypothetical protein